MRQVIAEGCSFLHVGEWIPGGEVDAPPPWGPRVLDPLIGAKVGPCNAHTSTHCIEKSPHRVVYLSYHSTSFFISSALHTILFSPPALSLKTGCLSHLVLLYLLIQPLLFFWGHFIMPLLNIFRPIVPKELVCHNIKIWPHLAEVVGNKRLTRGQTDRASNSNLLLAPCWLVVLPRSARFPLPVVSWNQTMEEHFISVPPSSLLLNQIYWYWPFAEIKRADPWATRAKFRPIKEHFTNQQGKAGAVSPAGPVKLK